MQAEPVSAGVAWQAQTADRRIHAVGADQRIGPPRGAVRQRQQDAAVVRFPIAVHALAEMHAVLDAEHEDLAQRLAVRAVAIVAVVTASVSLQVSDGGPRPATASDPGTARPTASASSLQEQLILRGWQAVGQRGLAGPVNADAVALGAAVGRGVLFIDVKAMPRRFRACARHRPPRPAPAMACGRGRGHGGFQWVSMETA